MPKHLPEKELDAAEAAVAYARQVRRFHARRSPRDAKQRIADIELALQRLRAAMGPLKSLSGRFPYGPQTSMAEANRQAVRDASAAIQRERMKLWKMLPPSHKKEKKA